jgi:hypothetical protein
MSFECQPPLMAAIDNGRNVNSWKTWIQRNVNPNVQALVLILPGQKNKAPLYKDLKKLLTEEKPCAV